MGGKDSIACASAVVGASTECDPDNLAHCSVDGAVESSAVVCTEPLEVLPRRKLMSWVCRLTSASVALWKEIGKRGVWMLRAGAGVAEEGPLGRGSRLAPSSMLRT